MKTKLTITVDPDTVTLAKSYAKSKGVSLSSLIEQALLEMTKDHQFTFSEKWRGKFKSMTDAEIESARYEFLAHKYGL